MLIAMALCTHASAASDAFVDDCERLTRDPHRLAGTPAMQRATEHVAQRLREFGVDEVLVHEFAIPQTRVERCEMEMEAGVVPLLPMRPNGIVPPASGAGGITGPLLHVGDGAASDYGSRSPLGAIVVLDYNAGDAWLRAFRLGARAVVFTRSRCARAWAAHFVNANAPLPRFYYDGPADDLPEGATVTIHSDVPWKPADARNVYGLIRGTDPVFYRKTELVVIAARLDTYGEVPRRSPGGRGAATVAALLRVAGELAENRSRRHVLIALLDAEARGHAGADMLYRALVQGKGGVAARRKSFEKEQQFLAGLEALLSEARPVERSGDVRDALVDRLGDIGEERVEDLRRRAETLRRGDQDIAPEQIDQALAGLKEQRDRWNDLRRALARGRVSVEVEPMMAAATDVLRGQMAARRGELERTGRSLDVEHRVVAFVDKGRVVLHVSLLLGDRTGRFGVAIGGDSFKHSSRDQSGFYTQVQRAFLDAHRDVGGAADAEGAFSVASTDGSLSTADLIWAAPKLVHSGEQAGVHGIYNVALCTVQEDTPREGTPDDTLDRINLGRVRAQANRIGPMLHHVADAAVLSQPASIDTVAQRLVPTFDGRRARGPMAMASRRGSAANFPVGGAVIQAYVAPRIRYETMIQRPYAFDDFRVLLCDANGTYELEYGDSVPTGFALASRSDETLFGDFASNNKLKHRVHLVRGRSGAMVLPPQVQVWPPSVLNAVTDGRIDRNRHNGGAIDGVAWWFADERIASVKLFGLESAVALLNGPDRLTGSATDTSGDVRKGTGLVAIGASPQRSAPRSATDLWRLNEARLQVLRNEGVANRSVERLHRRVEDLLRDAERTGNVARHDALAAAAFLTARTVYRQARSALDDLVHAVLVLLALSVPFAFAVERLVIGSVSVYRQIAWFGLFFALVFAILYATHPAFAVAPTPLIIFLAFSILTLSMMAIFILLRKFEVELKVLQGLTTTLHSADVSRFGTILAAVGMGISTMRRRPLRTGLTALTIVLLTFTILCFASFDTEIGLLRLYVRPAPPYPAVQYVRVNRTPVPDSMLDLLGHRWSSQVVVCPRYWLVPEPKRDDVALVTREDGTRPMPIGGVMGLEPAELDARHDLRDLLGSPARLEGGVLITRAAADRVGVEVGERVLIGGVPLEVVGTMDAASLAAVSDPDGGSILPARFRDDHDARTEVRPPPADPTALPAEPVPEWTTMLPDTVAIVSNATARRLGGALHMVHLYPPDRAGAAAIAGDLARTVRDPVVATLADGVYRHVLGPVVRASRAGDLVFPLLLGGLVVFGTMLGSVADREREIYSFSALGLAPAHVAGLFFAEAMVYAIVGGLGGYLLAQAVTKVLAVTAGFGWIAAPQMNYSSTNTMVAILIVMATVLVSAIYPAVRASRSANPGIMRAWRLPAPEGDVLDLTFPFTVSNYDFVGIVGYLKEHFDAYADTGLGIFLARDVALARRDRDALGLDALIALAPFDLGVTQDFRMRRRASGIEGIEEITIRLERRSGQPKDWRRLNQILLNDLRRQLLIWRSLPHDTMEIYRRRTLEG
ncbi:MAG: hypothetical protein CMJ18_10550 [Phycisphaeraceae bacterium]|nr:hypothetical protein [Phycisphaeraceae bacterium]